MIMVLAVLMREHAADDVATSTQTSVSIEHE